MRILKSQATKAAELEPSEADFPLPIADPAIPPMHRRCVLKGCSYRSPFLFTAGWMLALLFLITTVAIGFHGFLGMNAQQALLSENALLIQALRERPAAPVVAPAPVATRASVDAPAAEAATTPTTPAPPKVSKPPELPPAREKITSPKLDQNYMVPEAEKWWNR